MARMVKKHFEISRVNLERDADGSANFNLQDTRETILKENMLNNGEDLIPAVIDTCFLTMYKEEVDKEDGESEYLNPNMNYRKSYSSESGLFQLTIKISLVSIFLLSVLLLVIIFSIPNHYDHGADNIQQDLGLNHAEENRLYLVNAKFRSIIFKHFPNI